MNERLELAIAAYHDGTLDAAGSHLLVEALRGGDGVIVRELIAFDGLLGQAFVADEAVERSVRERIDGERSASAMVRAVRGSLSATKRRQQTGRHVAWLPRVAAAALLLVVVGAGWWVSARTQPRPGECRLEANVPLMVTRSGVSVAVDSGGSLLAGDRFRTTMHATLVWSDGSRVMLAPETQVDVTRPALGPGCRLEHGTATAEIAIQRPGLPFTIVTPDARVEVLGTRFQVMAGARRTQIDLEEGIVRLTRSVDGRALTLRANDSAVVAPGEEFVVRSRVASAPVVQPTTPVTPLEPAWMPLFPAQDLAGWETQHGAWSNIQGVVRGSDAKRGKARLLGRQSFADLDLSCRLRITGVEFAELQVGTYNWFVEVPANGAEWIQVELGQRGEHLTVTADGHALKNHPGDGAAMRAGALAFYVMPGGTLEISEAKFRVPLSEPSTTR